MIRERLVRQYDESRLFGAARLVISVIERACQMHWLTNNSAITISLGAALILPSIVYGQTPAASGPPVPNTQTRSTVQAVEEVDGGGQTTTPIQPSGPSRVFENPPGSQMTEDGSTEFTAGQDAAPGSVIVGDCCPVDGSDGKSSGPNMPTKPRKIPLYTRFGNGFEFYTKDEEFTLQLHNLTQIDYRNYGVPGTGQDKDGFVIPREWMIFQGRMTKAVDYYTAFAFGNSAVNLLDSYIQWHVIDDRFQVKFGRYKTAVHL